MASVAVTASVNLGFRSISGSKSSLSSKQSPPLSLRRSIGQHHLRSSSSYTSALISRLPSLKLKSPNRNLIFTVKESVAAVPAKPDPAPAPVSWQGAAMKPLLASIATGVILWFIPVPSGVSKNSWQLLSLFLATIVGIITQPLPLGAVALMGLGACVLTIDECF